MNNKQNFVKKLIYSSKHRGCKETDIILGDFVDTYIEDLNDEELEFYANFIELPDNDIYNWVNGREELPANLKCRVTELLLGMYN